mgnify:CR=1 FL=1
MRNWRRWCARRSSNSTARLRSAWPRARRRRLPIVDRLAHEPALKTYHLLRSVRGDLLQKLGRFEEARAAFEAAAGLAGNKREQDLLKRRAAEAAPGNSRSPRCHGRLAYHPMPAASAAARCMLASTSRW